MGLKIYHNPKCSKSRRALALIQERGIEPEIVEYLQKPFKPSELRETLAKLALRPRDVLRQKEAKEEGFADDLADEALIQAICAHPRTLQRPIIVNGHKAVLGRPPENVLRIL